MNPSTPSTPNNRKRAITINLRDRTGGAFSASTGIVRGSTETTEPIRPITHDGRLQPASPDRSAKRNFTALSPRHIHFKMQSDVSNDERKLAATPNRDHRITTPSSMLRKPRIPVHHSGLNDMESISKIEEEFSNAETLEGNQLDSRWPKLQFEGPWAKFVKKDNEESPVKRRKPNVGNLPNHSILPPATAYPSLSYRLNASLHQGTSQSPSQVPTTTTGRGSFKPSPLFRHKAYSHNLTDTGKIPGGSTMIQSKQSVAEDVRSHSTNWRPDASTATLTHPAAPPSSHLPPTAPTSTFEFFRNMEMEDILDYLLESRQQGVSSNAPYLHVTCRHNVEKTARDNFYDIVALEDPGNPASELVWISSRCQRTTTTGSSGSRVLDPSLVMQLSLHGLLVKHMGENGGELIDLRDFMLQRSQVTFLRTGRFFGNFRELKVFTVWRNYARSCSVQRARRQLLKQTYFSEKELILCVQYMNNIVYNIGKTVNLFVFAGKGSMCITKYIELQFKHLLHVKTQLQQQITLLSDYFCAQYEEFAQSAVWEERVLEVQLHHPFKDLFQQTTPQSEQLQQPELPQTSPPPQQTHQTTGQQSVPGEGVHVPGELMKLHAIKRIKEEFLQKLKHIFICAQLKVDTIMTELLQRFWLRLQQFILGIRKLIRSKQYQEEYYWELNTELFSSGGEMLTEVVEVFNTTQLFTAVHPSLEMVESTEEVLQSEDKVAGSRADEENASAAAPAQVRFHSDTTTAPVSSDKGTRISVEWESTGSHLCVDINLCIGHHCVELSDLMNLTSIDDLKVVIFPGRTALMEQLHGLCGALGDLLASLPQLRKHPLIFDSSLLHPPEYDDPDIDLADLTHPTSLPYFKYMLVHPTYSATGGHELAVETIRLLQTAYLEATAVETHLYRLFEIVRRLWALSPAQLAKQTERSLVLGKMKAFIDHPDSVEDLKRTQTRDLGKIKAFQTGADYLRTVGAVLEGFQNIKYKHGLIASFQPIVQQLYAYRAVQSYLLFTRLPVSFNTRCSVFYDYIRLLEETVSCHAGSYEGFIALLHRLQNFESVREVYEGEVDICESMYKIIVSARAVPTSALDAQIQSMFNTRRVYSLAKKPVLSSDKLFQLFTEVKEGLYMTISRAKAVLLGQLNTIKNETFTRRNCLHQQINVELEKLKNYTLITVDISPEDVSSFLSECEKNVQNLRKSVDETVDAQLLLLIAHDIVGAAYALLKQSDVDKFGDMDELESTYNLRCQAWNCIKNVTSIKEQLLSSKLVPSKIASWNAQFSHIVSTYNYLFSHITEEGVLQQIHTLILDLQPKLEIASFLACTVLRARHWQWLSKTAFAECKLALRFTGRNQEFVAVVDVSKKEAVGLGNMHRLCITELISRGIESQMAPIRGVTSEAVIEATLESTLTAVESSIKTFCVQGSGEWVRDPRLRDKIYLELNQIVNITQLSVMVKYCMKSILIVENTSQDMSLTTFDLRIDKLKTQVQKLENFIRNLGDAQRLWFYLLHFVKFSSRGELDRDSTRLFNSCTEDLKKIEMILQQRSENLLLAYTSNETELNTELLKSSLSIILEDAHGSVQSMLDACPRLSLLSYNRLVKLMKVWMLGPHTSIPFISQCLQALFQGVGVINTAMHMIQRLYMCTGFISQDNVEVFIFAEQIPLNLPLDEFIRRFHEQMRLAVMYSCDSIVSHRVNCLQALLTDTPAVVVLQHIGSVFEQRMSQLIAMFSDALPNMSYYLISACSFAEDVWTALGHPTGAMILSRDDLSIEQASFAKAWRTSLLALLSTCNENIAHIQDMLLTAKEFTSIRPVKAESLLSSLLLLEVSFLRTIEELQTCKSLESATELWAGRYQLRFQYNRAERHHLSPVDISFGSINIPYGLEYTGAAVRVVLDTQLENALQKVLSAAYSQRGAVFISYDNQQSLFESPGEYSVSSTDIAAALGRLSTTLVSASDKHAVQFYLARLIYLDAVGSVDFTNISHAGLQILIHTMNAFWHAIECKNDQFLQDGLKFPLKNKFSRNDLQSERRKVNLTNLRNNINALKTANRYIGPVIIGMASESFYSNISVFDHFYRNIFNAISIPNHEPINNMGLMLSAAGFLFGMDIQTTLKTSILHLGFGKNVTSEQQMQELIIERLCTSLEIRSLVSTAAKTLKLYHLSRVSITIGRVARFKIELQCFCSVLWERVLMFAYETNINISNLRNELFIPFYKKLEMISSPEEILGFDANIGSNELGINEVLNSALIKTSSMRGLVCNHEYIAKCALLWALVTNPSNSVVLLTGEAAVGKTAMRDTVFSTVRRLGSVCEAFFSESWPVKCRRSAYVILGRLQQWRAFRLQQREEQRRRDQQALLRGQHEDDTAGTTTTVQTCDDPTLLTEEGGQQSGEAADAHSSFPLATGTGGFVGARRASVSIDVPLMLTKEQAFDAAGSTRSVRTVAQPPKQDISTERERQAVHVSVVYHASLSVKHLLGHYDSNGRWLDGILVRKIRAIDENNKQYDQALVSSSTRPFTVIVLNGPTGYYVEQLFTAPAYFASSTAVPEVSQLRRTLLFPSAEVHQLGADVKVLIETNDISHASPSFFVTVPMLKVSVTYEVCIKRLLTLWVRSVIHWLGDFPPWLDTLDFLGHLLLKTSFVADLLAADPVASQRGSSSNRTDTDSSSTTAEVPAVVVVSRVSTFLRLLEDLLLQVHQRALIDATFVIPDDKEDSDSSDSDLDMAGQEDLNASDRRSELRTALGTHISLPSFARRGSVLLKGAMQLPSRSREVLSVRARLSVIYAALWGFGGAANSTERRRSFDTEIRDAVEKYFYALDEFGQPSGVDELEITTTCSLFECQLDLDNCAIKQAVEVDPRSLQILSIPGIPKKFEELCVYAELLAGSSAERTVFGVLDRLVFRTPSTRAVDAVVRRLLGTGANLVLFGDKGCGKSRLIEEVLDSLRANLPTPQKMRDQVSGNLVDIVNGTKKTEGIFAALEILKYIMSKFATCDLTDDTKADFHYMWNTAGEGLKMLWSENARKNCTEKTVSSTVTSLRGTPSASDLRAWLEREFTTEARTVLETPRFSYGVAFVDDLHFCAQEYDRQDMRLLENRSEALLKGLADGTPLFNIQRNTAVRSTVYLGLHTGSFDGGYRVNDRQTPVLHQKTLSDLRMQTVQLTDDFVLQRIGLVSAATGQFADLVDSPCFTQILPHFCTVGLPSMNSNELHTALIAGASVCMSAGASDFSIVDALRAEITELSRFTMNMCSKMISPSDHSLTCPIERAVRSLVLLDVSLVARFCTSLRFGCSNVNNPGGLLQLYTHEWKRYFLDPLPDGAQRQRIVQLLCDQVDSIDEQRWAVSADWLKALQEDFAAYKDRVWTDSRVFEAVLHSDDAAPDHNTPSESRSVSTGAASRPSLVVNTDLSPVPSTNPTPTTTAATSAVTPSGSCRLTLSSRLSLVNPASVAATPTSAATKTVEPVDSQHSATAADTTEEAVAPTVAPLHRLYLPVELDRAGTERGLLSGAWDHTQREYRPIQTAEEIAQGEISKVLDFTSEIGAGDMRRVLYPAAISLILRMVRILSVAGKHVLLAGYYGTTRLTALHLAAKICNLQAVTFDVKQSPGVVEMLPSANAAYSVDFKHFLKSVVYRAAGLRVCAADTENTVEHSSTATTVCYEIVPAEKLLVAVQSCQQLSEQDRVTLLNLIDYEDPGYLFSDSEVLGMTEALRAQIKERLQANNLCSDGQALEEQEAATLAGSNIHLHIARLRLDSATEEGSVKVASNGGTPLLRSRKNSVRSESERGRTASMDVSTPNNETQGAEEEEEHGATQKLRPIFTGYAFQFIKDFLQQAVRTHMSLVIDVDLPRAMKLDASGASVNAAAIVRKMAAAGQPPRQPGSGGQGGDKRGSVSAVGSGSTVPGRARQVSVRQRYSLLSSRKTSVHSMGDGAGGTAGDGRTLNAAGSFTDRLVYTPNQVNTVQSEAEQNNSDPTFPPAASSQWNTAALNPTSSTEAHGIFSCSILGPMLSRRFYMLWYDIDGVDASRGICTMLMKNERKTPRLFHPVGVSGRGVAAAAETTSPITLSLRTSQIGVYITGARHATAEDSKNTATTAATVNVDPSSGSGVESGRSRVAAARLAQDKTRADKEEKRRNKFKSTTVLSRFNLLIKTDSRYNTLALDQFGLLSHVGVFKSFRSAAAVSLDPHRELQVDWNVASFIDEARAILPHVLSVNLAADAVFLSEPVICPGPEVTAELASVIVMQLLNTGSRYIIRRKIILEGSLQAYKDAAAALENASDINQRLVQHNQELQSAMRRLIRDIDVCRRENEGIQRTFERTNRYEVECMLQEDVHSKQHEIAALDAKMDALINPIRRRIFNYSATDWQTFAVPFSARPSRSYLELMRAIMIAIRFTPPQKKGDKAGTGKMDDATVCRCATSLLLKFAEFASQLCTVVPSALPKSHLQALRMLNQLLNSTIATHIAHDQQTPHYRLQYVSELLDSDITPINNVFEMIKKYLLLIDVAAAVAEYNNGVQTSAEACQKEVQRVAQENLEARQKHAALLKARSDEYISQMHTVDATLARNRLQLETIERNNVKKPAIIKGMQQSSAFALAELKQVKDVLKYLVTDCCVAVAVLLRAGWLPEQIRQECTEQLRQNLIKYDVRVSDSPFVLGHLADRLQMRQWSAQGELSLPRDPASLNAMALLHLVPYFALIVDPDGTAPSVLLADPLEGYDKYTITAQKFSLATFQTWLATTTTTTTSTNSAISVIVTDLQAGVSDDLVCFLSSDFADTCAWVPASSGDDRPLQEGSPRGSVTCSPRENDQHRSESPRSSASQEGISLIVNPALNMAAAHTDSEEECGRSTGGRHVIHIPCRLRLYLVSAKAPSMDSFGVSRPLPTSCMKHITTVHWSVHNAPSHCVDAKPTQAAEEKQYASDQTLSYRMGAQVCKRLSPLHFQYHSLVNDILISDELNLYALEDSLIASVHAWHSKERLLQSVGDSSVGAVPDRVHSSLLDSEGTLAAVLETVQARRRYIIDIEMNKTLQRELATFLSTVTEVCGMAVDYIRMCASLLPAEILTPYALSTQALCSAFLAGVLDLAAKKSFLQGLPASLAEMTRISKAIIRVQRRVRAGNLPRRHTHHDANTAQPPLSTTPQPPASSSAAAVPATKRSMRKYSRRDRRRSSVQQMVTHELSHKRFGLRHTAREQAASDLACLLLPLRTFLLREVVNYVQLSLRPGLEWLGKFMMVLTTWSHSENPLPAAELRTLVHFVMQSAQQSVPRYSHFISFDGQEKGDLSRDLHSLARYTRESTLSTMRRSRSGGSASSHARSASGSTHSSEGGTERRMSRLQSPTGRPSNDSPRGPGDSQSSPRQRLRSTSEEESSELLAEEDESYDEFVADLPSAGTMQNRVTAFRVNEQAKMRASVRFVNDGAVPAAGPVPEPGLSSRRFSGIAATSLIASPSESAAALHWMERGSGLIDGLWLNRRSTRWRLSPHDQHYNSQSNTSSKILRGRLVMMDVNGTAFTLKNTLFRPSARQGDPFEAEWLRVKGVRLFATTSATAAVALGASLVTVEEIQTSRRSMLAPPKVVQGGLGGAATAPSTSASASVGTTSTTATTVAAARPSVRKASAGNVRRQSESKVRKASRPSVLLRPPVSPSAQGLQARAPASVGGGTGGARASFTSKHRRLSITAESLPDLHSESDSGTELTKSAPVLNVAARTLYSGRVSMALTNMTTGVGEHRASLHHADPTAPTAFTTGGAAVTSAEHSKRRSSTSISQLCMRKASVLEQKQQRTSHLLSSHSSSPSQRSTQACTDPLQGLRNRFNADGAAVESLSDLLTSPLAYQNMLMLETHASLAPVFKGTAAGILRNLQDFADWKMALFALTSVDPTKLSDKDLEMLLFTIKPPVFDDCDDESAGVRTVDEGLWLKGFELTMIQTLLLSEAIVPGSCGSLVEVLFALIAVYLRADGHIAQHPDEQQAEEASDSEDDYFDEDEDEEQDDDAFDVHSTALSRHASNVHGSIFSVSSALRNNSAASVHSETSRSTFFQGLENFRRMTQISVQDGVALINCWHKLERVLNGTSKERGPRYIRPAGVAESAVSCRDFENWESVLLEVLTEELGMEKFVFMKELRDTTLGSKSSVFLASHLHASQIAVFSQRARDLAVHNYDHISVVNCASPLNEELQQKQHRTALSEAIRTIKSSVASQRAKKAIVEMLNLQSPYGNSLISSVLLHAGHATTGAMQKSQDATVHHDMSSLNMHVAKKEPADAVAAVVDKSKPGVYVRPDKLPWQQSFPLIISSQWGGVAAGRGPFMTMAELSYTWLPRFFSPDVINADTDTREPLFTKFAGLPPSLPESCGILCEELETSLLWVMNSTKSLARSQLTAEIRQRLRRASRIEIRVTAALVTIWQLVQYVRCARREESEVPAVWSACLNPVSLWQLTRLMLKTSNILQVGWEGANIASILKQQKYVKAMWLLAESFSNTECDIYNFTRMFETASKKGPNSVGHAARRTVVTPSAVPTTSAPPMAVKATGAGRAAAPVRATYIQQLKRSSRAGVGAVTGVAVPRASTRRVGANINPLVMSALSAPTATSETANMSSRAKKLLKRAVKQVEEARGQYVQTLCAADKFTLQYAHAEGAQVPLTHASSDADFSATTAAAEQAEALEKEFMSRFLSLMGIYFAQVLLEARHLNNNSSGSAGSGQSDAFANIANLASRAMDARRQSNKINIQSFLQEQDGAAGLAAALSGQDREHWPDIPGEVDLSFGSLSAADVIKCLVKWTFNGGEASAHKTKGKLNTQKLINSIKKLSLLVKSGKVTL